LLPAPQTELFGDRARTALVSEEFATTTSFDRMAHRLDGPTLQARAGHDIVSDGIVAGAVQVPGDGTPWVLTADHQTTGGYPKIAVLTQVALARLVRLPPGSTVRFAWSDLATARAQLQAAHEEVERVVAGAVRASPLRLVGQNLVGGVVDAS
jgi:allophanate hydrolase